MDKYLIKEDKDMNKLDIPSTGKVYLNIFNVYEVNYVVM